MLGPEADGEGLGLDGDARRRAAKRSNSSRAELPGASTTRSESRRVPSASRTPATASVGRRARPRPASRSGTSQPPAISSSRSRATANGSRSRADVRLAVDEDAVRRAVAREGLDHLAHQRVVDARARACRRCTRRRRPRRSSCCSRGRGPVAHQLRDVLPALHHLAAALEEDAMARRARAGPARRTGPPGPVPTMMGRRSGVRTCAGGGGAGSVSVTSGGSRVGARPSAKVTSTVWMVRGRALLAGVEDRTHGAHRRQVVRADPERLGRATAEQRLRLVRARAERYES